MMLIGKSPTVFTCNPMPIVKLDKLAQVPIEQVRMRLITACLCFKTRLGSVFPHLPKPKPKLFNIHNKSFCIDYFTRKKTSMMTSAPSLSQHNFKSNLILQVL